MMPVLLILGGFVLYNYIMTGAAMLRMQAELLGFKIHNMGVYEITGTIDLKLTNLATVPLHLTGVQGQIFINNEYMGLISTPLRVVLNSYQSGVVTINYSISSLKFWAMISRLLTNLEQEKEFTASLNGRIISNNASFPLNNQFGFTIPGIDLNAFAKLFDKKPTV